MASFYAVEVLDPHTGSAGLFHRDTSHGAAAIALKDAWGQCQAGASAMGLYAVSPLESHQFELRKASSGELVAVYRLVSPEEG